MAGSGSAAKPLRVFGRYALYEEIASGGMAAVHLGRLLGSAGFSKTVAIKRLHPQFAKDPDFSTMFLDEARLASRVRHANVVQLLDVISSDGEIFLVMEYVHGESFAYLLKAADDRGKRLPVAIVCNIVAASLYGLHAAHEAVSESGKPLGIVHRDVSPQNILVGIDGVSRVLDFGVAKAMGNLHTTREGQIKGKLRYMAPEQILGGRIGPRTDLWAASVMLWEALTGQRLFAAENDVALLRQVLEKEIPCPRTVCPEIPEALAELVMRGLRREQSERIGSALEYAAELEDIAGLVNAREIGEWVRAAARDLLAARARRVVDVESVATQPTCAPVGKTIPPTREKRRSARARAGRFVVVAGTLVAAVTGLWLSRAPLALSVPAPNGASSEAVSVAASPESARSDTSSASSLPEPVQASAVESADAPRAPAPAASASVEPAALSRPAAKPAAGRTATHPATAPAPSAAPTGYRLPLYGRD